MVLVQLQSTVASILHRILQISQGVSKISQVSFMPSSLGLFDGVESVIGKYQRSESIMFIQ